MGFEVKIVYHPRKEGGGYDTEKREEQLVPVGKPFDETPLEKLATAIMYHRARRDIMVIDVEPVELTRKEIRFKECDDGDGIILKNKRFSMNDCAQLVADDVIEGQPQYHQPQYQPVHVVQGNGQQVQVVNSAPVPAPAQHQQNGQFQHPHEMIAAQKNQNMDDLYSNPNRPVPVVRQGNSAPVQVNPNKVLYEVFFEPYFHEAEAKRLKLKFSEDRKYKVHQVIPDPRGRLDNQKIAVTDDSGKVVILDEKFFTTAGQGLMLDKKLGFSGSNGRGVRKPKLAYEDELTYDVPNPKAAGQRIHDGIPVDDGTIPEDFLEMPDIRPGRRP